MVWRLRTDKHTTYYYRSSSSSSSSSQNAKSLQGREREDNREREDHGEEGETSRGEEDPQKDAGITVMGENHREVRILQGRENQHER